MKVVTFNLKGTVKLISILSRLAALITVIALVFYFSSFAFKGADFHVQALNELTDDKIVIIDAGHGGEDCGAIGIDGRYEKDLNFEISCLLGEMLSEKGYSVVYTRTTDKLLYSEEENIKGLRKFYDLKNRCKIAKEYENSLFISIHMNSFAESKYSGLQVYFSPKDPTSEALAGSIQSAVADLLQPQNKRSVKKATSRIFILNEIKKPAVLVECAFLSNPEECRMIATPEYRKKLTFCIFSGICEFISENSY